MSDLNRIFNLNLADTFNDFRAQADSFTSRIAQNIPILGPIKSLDEPSRYAAKEALAYPENIQGYAHSIKFNINLPERSQYNGNQNFALDPSGISSQADANRAGTTQLGNTQGITAGDATVAGLAGAFVKNLGNISKSVSKGNYDKAAGQAFGSLGAGAVASIVAANVDLTRKTRRLMQSIVLHIPDTVQNTMLNEYDAISLTEALGMTGFIAQGSDAVGSGIADTLKEVGSSIANGGSGRTKDRSSSTSAAFSEALGAAAKATGQFGGGIEQVINASFGVAQNPQVEILYKTINHREFQFDFKFTPKSKAEADSVLKIIKAFRFHAAPELVKGGGGARYFIPPSEFDIEYLFNMNGHPALHKFSTCVLLGVDVNYVTAGQFATFEDGTPVEIAMQLRFKEVEIMHKELIDQGY
jgi:hypothetical protein